MNSPLSSPPTSPKKTRVLLLLAVSLLLITGSVFLTSQEQSGIIIVTFPNGHQIETDVADTPQKIFFGLAFQESLPIDRGMLYIFQTSDRHRLMTKGYKIPVDMLWLDESKYVVHLVENALPCAEDPCPFYGPPPDNARYVLQTVAGLIKQQGLATGVELKFILKMS